MSSILDLMMGKATLITGLEQDPDEPEFDRIYVGPRYHWRYVLVEHGTVHLGPAHNFTTLTEDAAVYEDTEGRERASRDVAR